MDKTNTVIIGLIGAYIAYQQFRVNRTKLQMDLYDRRFAIYDAVQEIYGEIFRNGSIKAESTIDFARKKEASLFLFGEEMESYLEMIRHKAIDLYAVRQRLSDSGLPVGESRSAAAQESSKLMLWFVDEHPKTKKRFARYLSVNQLDGKWKLPSWRRPK